MSLNSSSNSSLHPPLNICLTTANISILAALIVAYFLPLSLFVFVLYLGYQRWREQRSVATTTSHSDIFTFHMVVIEIIGILGFCFLSYGTYTNDASAMGAGFTMLLFISPGKTLFHLLTCVERYLAVVHPVTYRGLRQAGGVRIRNISIGCVWLLCFGSSPLSVFIPFFQEGFTFLLEAFACVAVSFCSLSVLCVLIRPGPGEVGGNRERVDQSKQRAFYTITAIMGALFLRFLSSLFSVALMLPLELSHADMCLMWFSNLWFSLPCSVVLPLLFLHRAGKLPGCKRNSAQN